MTLVPETTPAVGKLAAGPGSLGMRTQPVRPPGPGEVLIEVLATGICGTDLHIADDEFPSEPPVTMGHEVTGEVAVVGEGVDAGWLGARVACETYYSYCEVCDFCRDGKPNLCADRRSIGSREDGGFARWLTVPGRSLWRLPDHLGIHAGALVEPLACVTRCLFDPPVINAGDTVLVVGPGTMGVLTAQAARAAGGVVTLGRPRAGPRSARAGGVARVYGCRTQMMIEPTSGSSTWWPRPRVTGAGRDCVYGRSQGWPLHPGRHLRQAGHGSARRRSLSRTRHDLGQRQHTTLVASSSPTARGGIGRP